MFVEKLFQQNNIDLGGASGEIAQATFLLRYFIHVSRELFMCGSEKNFEVS